MINGSPVLSANSLTSDNVYDRNGKEIGSLKEIMIDTAHGRVAYGVLSFGGVFGFGDKLFALPWDAITVDTANKRLIADVTKERLKDAEGFDKNNWPDFASPMFRDKVYAHWNGQRYWT